MVKNLILFLIGGIGYYGIEVLWRGYSHPSMIIVGGLCFILIGLINEYLSWDTPLVAQCLIATIIVLSVEFISGMILNVWLGLNVWDYSSIKYNILGQICLQYAVMWYFLSCVAIILDDILRWRLFNEEKPKYRMI